MSTTGGIKVFSGNANRALTQEICNYLSCDPGSATTDRFSDGEFNFQITEYVRGAHVFIVQPTCPPTDAHLMELLVMLDAFRRSSAERVTAVTMVLVVLERYHSTQLAGLAMLLLTLPGLIFSPIAGAILDRRGRSRLIASRAAPV